MTKQCYSQLDLNLASAAGSPPALPPPLPAGPPRRPRPTVGIWTKPFEVVRNRFHRKSLANWAANPVVGCQHGCGFCYAADCTRGTHQELGTRGINDPAHHWGEYAFVRPWQPDAARKSILAALATPEHDLEADGNRAVMLSTTTDPYQTLRAPGSPETLAAAQHELTSGRRGLLQMLAEYPKLRVRILTRSPRLLEDVDLLHSLGDQCVVGMSIPTLDAGICSRYEPHAPNPKQRLEALRMARAAGLHVYVAIAPVPPEVSPEDLDRTMQAVASLDPVTVFFEPINAKPTNLDRMRAGMDRRGVDWLGGLAFTPENWPTYAVSVFRAAECSAARHGLSSVLHPWPPDELAGLTAWQRVSRDIHVGDYDTYRDWITDSWGRISNWPGQPTGRRL